MSVPLPLLSRLVRRSRLGRWLAPTTTVLLTVLILPGSALAQQGVVTGRVIDSELGVPLTGVVVELITSGGSAVSQTTTDNSGGFRLTGIPQGSYSLLISSLGYETQRVDGISVGTAPFTAGDIELVSRAFRLNPIVVTASRQQEKALDAPASVYVVDAEQIEERPAITTVDHVRGLPGVDVVTTGLGQHNVVARGFNNIFSGALFVLTDNRWASVPSLRFNAYNLIPTASEDIERIEIVLGPGSALYGPNVDKGVMHIITRSPLDHQESSFSVTGAARRGADGTEGVGQFSFRHAGLASENVGYKISATYLNGTDWKFTDPVEQGNRQTAIDAGADSSTLLIGARDFDSERFTGDARLDFRLDDQSTLTINGGLTRLISSIELTGIGAAQGDDWTYGYAQARFRRGQLFAQAYFNLSDAGDTFLLRDGSPIKDNSLLFVGQVQHGSNVGERQRFIYGADVIRTIPRTDSTITGQNENDDNIFEIGGYVQSETELSPMFDLVLAGRLDYHDVVDEVEISPRAALVFKPTPDHSFRATYNRAFSQPTSNNLFLDLISSATLGGLPFAVRATGSRDGFTFRRDCSSPVVEEGLCMRSPFIPDPATFLPLDATLLWDAAVGAVAAQDPAAGALLGLMNAPNATQVGTVMRRLNPTTAGFDLVTDVTDIDPIQRSITNTIEVGYKGLIEDRLLLGIDLYYTRIEDFIGPLIVETPSVFMDPATLGAYIASEAARLEAFLIAIGIGPLTPEQIGSLTAGVASVPVATVTPEGNPGNPADIFLTYRNFGDVDIFGADVAATLLATDQLSFTGSYSFVNDNFFANLGGISDIALNAPKNKGTIAGQYRNERLGVAAEVRARYVQGFPVNTGTFVAGKCSEVAAGAPCIDDYTLVDVNVTYALPFSRSTELTLSALNIFDDRHLEMIGAPELGRLVLLRVRQSF